MKFTVATLLALPLLAVATPAPLEARAGNCNTGPIQCCQQTLSDSSKSANLLAGLLGIVLSPIGALVGLDCSPISVIGVGTGNTCNASPVCCTNNNVGGLLSIGCVPVSL